MIRMDAIEQNSDEWHELKLGVASASSFNRIITPTGRPSAQAEAYATELAVESVTRLSKDSFYSKDMENGHLYEPDARKTFAFIKELDIEQTGFVFKDKSKLIGCSPDGLIPKHDTGLEIKCPTEAIHLGYLVDGVIPKAYIQQVQGTMWVTGCWSWWFMSYHQNWKPLIIEVKRDELFIQELEKLMGKFLQNFLKKQQILQEKIK